MRPPIRRCLSVCLRPKPITRYFILLSVPLFALAIALVHGFAAAPAPASAPLSAPSGAANGSGVERASGVPAMNAAAGISAALAAPLAPSPFTSGDLVVYRVGDGSAALGSGGTAVFLDEYTPAGVLVQSIAMPTTGTSGRLVASGSATTEGFLTRAEDGRYLVVPGYDAALGATVTSSTTVPRVIGRVDGSGVLDAGTSDVETSGAGNIRSACSVDGTRYWSSSSSQGQRTIVHGATTATVISTTNTNTRQINIFFDQLYIGSGASTVYRLATIGTGLPITAGQTGTTLPGFPVTQTLNSFFFAHLDGGTGADTFYVADEGNNQIQKWCLVSGSWVQRGSVPLTTPRGLTGV